MANLGRLRFVVQDADGTARSGVSVEVRRQGAQVSGAQAGSPYTLDAINGIVVGDVVALGTGTTTRAVSAISATTVTTGGGDLGAVSDDARISIATALPTLYEDAQGNTSTANPLTTGANGTVECYVTGGLYDVLQSGGGVTTTLWQDVATEGADTTVANAYTTGSFVVRQHDTLRAMAAGDYLLKLKNAGTDNFAVAGDGEITAGVAGATHNLTGTLTTSQGITATTGNLSLTAGSLSQAGVSGGITQTGGLGANTLTQPTTCSGNLTVSGSGKSLTVTATTGIVNSGGKTRTSGGALQIATMAAFTDLDATPDVSAGNYFQVSNSGATNVTNFDNGPNSATYAQVIHLLFSNANTTIVHDVTKIKNRSGANITPGANTTRSYISDASTPTIWYEVS